METKKQQKKSDDFVLKLIDLKLFEKIQQRVLDFLVIDVRKNFVQSSCQIFFWNPLASQHFIGWQRSLRSSKLCSHSNLKIMKRKIIRKWRTRNRKKITTEELRKYLFKIRESLTKKWRVIELSWSAAWDTLESCVLNIQANQREFKNHVNH